MKVSPRFLPLLALAACVVPAASARGDDPIPKPFPAGHFDKLAARSPFSPPTAAPVATPPPVVQGPRPFEKYTVALLMQQGNEYVATLNNKESSERVRLRTNEAPNEDGLTLVSVEWHDHPADTKVTLKKGTEFGVIGFDSSAAPVTAVSGMPAAGGVNRPGTARPIPPTPFRPPPGNAPNAGGPSSLQSANNARRQMPIRTPVAPLPGQPGVNFTNSPRPRPPIPGGKPISGGDDDDDD